jgi:hypothetical protein
LAALRGPPIFHGRGKRCGTLFRGRDCPASPGVSLPTWSRLAEKNARKERKERKAPRLAIFACRNVRTKLTKLTKSGVGDGVRSKADDLSARERPAVMQHLILRLGTASGGCPVMRFSKLSKMLFQERALSAPCSIGVNFGSPRAQKCCGQANPSLRLSLYGCYTQVIMPASTHALLVVGGSARAERHCKARQGRRGKTAPTFELTFTVVRFLEAVDRVRRYLW